MTVLMIDQQNDGVGRPEHHVYSPLDQTDGPLGDRRRPCGLVRLPPALTLMSEDRARISPYGEMATLRHEKSRRHHRPTPIMGR